MRDLPMPKPYAQRAADDAALLAAAPAVPDEAEAAPPMRSVAVDVSTLFAALGERRQTCEAHGLYVSRGRRVGRVGVEVWSGCPNCARAERDQAARDAEHAAQEARRLRLESALFGSLLPDRFIGRGFGDYLAETPGQERALAKVRDLVERFGAHAKVGTTLILAGGVGTGKSHLAGAAIQALLPARLCMYLTTSGLIRMVRETWRKDAARSEGEVLADLARVDLLVVDEVGVQYGTDSEKTLMLEVLDARYMARRPTILITNLDRGAFQAFIGDRLYDRLREVGTWVSFNWDSYRARARKGADE